MKITIAFCLGIILHACAIAQTVNADALTGLWLTGNGKAAVQIYKEGAKYNGKITWLKNPLNEEGKPRTDKNNPDKNKQGATLMGLNLLKDFIFEGDSKWEKGTIYDPDNGKVYSCKITMIDASKIEVRGFIGFSLLGRTQTWIRIQTDKK